MGKKTKVVIDTNIIVSAFGWRGNPEEVIRLVSQGKILNFITFEILDELRRVVSYPKLKFSEELQAEIIETMFAISHIVSSSESLSIIENDPPDDKVLECAVSADADFIISGDRHLLNLKNFRCIEILTPEAFLTKRVLNK
jgi:putative PIN family toxin of toxin-antitoxin system